LELLLLVVAEHSTFALVNNDGRDVNLLLLVLVVLLVLLVHQLLKVQLVPLVLLIQQLLLALVLRLLRLVLLVQQLLLVLALQQLLLILSFRLVLFVLQHLVVDISKDFSISKFNIADLTSTTGEIHIYVTTFNPSL
jgi:hypothetical protein